MLANLRGRLSSCRFVVFSGLGVNLGDATFDHGALSSKSVKALESRS